MKAKKGKQTATKDQLAKNHACYVLITCEAPEANGNMDVEVSYQGPPLLASFLLEGAQTYFEQQVEEEMAAFHLSDN